MADEAGLGGSEGGTDGELGSALGGASQEEVGYVDASDREDECDSSEDGEEGRADGLGDFVLEGIDEDSAGCAAGAVVTFRVEFRKSWKDRAEFAGGLLAGDVGAESGGHVEMMAPLAAVGGKRGVVLERRPEFGSGCEDVLKVLVHDADDGVERVVEADLGADDAGVASEAALPESVAEDGDVWAAEDVVGGLKAAADDGRDAQDLEVVRADALSFEAFGLVAYCLVSPGLISSRHGRLPGFHDGDGVEGVAALGESAEGGEGDIEWRTGAAHLP